MSLLLEGALRSSVVLALALAALPLLRRRPASLRHCVIAAAVFAAGLVAPLGWVGPVWAVRLPAHGDAALAGAGAFVTSSTALGTMNQAGPAPTDLAAAIWLLGAVIGIGALAAALLRVHRLARRAVTMTEPAWVRLANEVSAAAGLRRPLTVLQTDATAFLATFGARRPRLLVPVHARGWGEERVRAVLHHEVAHVQRHDWLLQLAADVVCILHWYNPLFWVACRRLRVESECACDDAVLRSGMRASEYAQHLHDIARGARQPGWLGLAARSMARPSTLRRRISAMLNTRLRHDSISRATVGLVVVALAALALPAAALRAAQDGPLPLMGFVYDPSGAVLPGAALTLEDERENQWESVTDATGRFEFPPVEAGQYTLGVSLPGFRPLTQAIGLTHERDWQRAVTLQVGTVQETIVVREARLPAAPAAAAVDAARVRVGGNVRPPLKVRDVPPTYPESMREAGLEGLVPLDAIISRTGDVQSVRVLTAAVHPDLARAAVEAVRQWQFEPTLLNGEPVEVVMTVSVLFDLEE